MKKETLQLLHVLTPAQHRKIERQGENSNITKLKQVTKLIIPTLAAQLFQPVLQFTI